MRPCSQKSKDRQWRQLPGLTAEATVSFFLQFDIKNSPGAVIRDASGFHVPIRSQQDHQLLKSRVKVFVLPALRTGRLILRARQKGPMVFSMSFNA